MRAVPVAVAVKVTEQLPETNAQVVELNEPAGPVSVNVTVPMFVPLLQAFTFRWGATWPAVRMPMAP